ncbi:MAG: peptide deformylase [Christensenellales bacterium]|jgi:peptide deformylase
MAVRRIFHVGDEVLRRKARRVDTIDRRIVTLLNDMAETMYAADGVGLAAPQVGILRRVVVIDTGDGLIELINPEIVSQEGEQESCEGCLSVPGRRGKVPRPEKVVVRAQDRRGRTFEIEGTEIMAIALCHELDHLDGILYIDKMTEDMTDREEE